MLTGDVNLMGVTDPAAPFARITDTLRQADVLFGNLECCFHEPAGGHALEREGFYAPLASAQTLAAGNFHAPHPEANRPDSQLSSKIASTSTTTPGCNWLTPTAVRAHRTLWACNGY